MRNEQGRICLPIEYLLDMKRNIPVVWKANAFLTFLQMGTLPWLMVDMPLFRKIIAILRGAAKLRGWDDRRRAPVSHWTWTPDRFEGCSLVIKMDAIRLRKELQPLLFEWEKEELPFRWR